jgi:hypothetical protein
MTDAYEIRYSWTLTMPDSLVNALVPKHHRVHPIHGLIWCGGLRWTTLRAARASGLPYFKPCFIL